MEESALTFARPLWLYAIPVVVAGLWWFFRMCERKRIVDLAKLAPARFQSRLLPGVTPRLTRTRRILWLSGLALGMTAAAGPQNGYELREIRQRGIDLLFAVDTSKSMLAQDLSPNRLERARLGILDFVSRLRGDRVGLIPFAGSAYPLCPLTLDYEAFRESLTAVDTDLIPKQGTDVASAIQEAARLFEEQGDAHRLLVLITDGEDLQGDALEAAREQAKKGMVIYPVGVGSVEGVTIPIQLPGGRMDVIRDDAGNPVKSKLDESALREIARITGGLYVPLGRAAEGLDRLYQEKLRLVPASQRESRTERIPLDQYQWPLALAIGCFCMEFLLPNRRRPVTAARLPSAARRHPLPRGTALPLLLTAWCCFQITAAPARAGGQARELYNQGTSAYHAGDFPGAADLLRQSLATPDPALQAGSYYNLGNACYRIGQAAVSEDPGAAMTAWKDAIKAYDCTLALEPGDADARFNRDLVQRKLKALEDQHPEEKEKQKQEGEESKDPQEGESKEDSKSDSKPDSSEGQSGDSKKSEPGQEQKEGESGEKKGEEGEGSGEKSDQPNGKKPGKKSGESPESGEAGNPESDEEKSGENSGKEGSGKEASGKEDPDAKAADGEAAGAKAADGKPKTEQEKSSSEERREAQKMMQQMSPAEAEQLVRMMKGEQRMVIPMENLPRRRNFLDPNNTTKGKTW